MKSRARCACHLKLTHFPPRGEYRPHVVGGDPHQRKALFVNNVAQEHYLGVAFVGAPANVAANESFVAELALLYWPNVSYDSLVPGATFTLREGPHIVGFGTVKTAQQTARHNNADVRLLTS